MTIKTKPLPSQELLRKLLDYDSETGVLTWKPRPLEMFSKGKLHAASTNRNRWNSAWAGKPALNSLSHYGYLVGGLNGKTVFAHRVAWKLAFNQEPEQIDHINGIRTDNRVINMRSVSNLENSRNRRLHTKNKSGVNGVSWDEAENKWLAKITVRGKQIYLGRYVDIELAEAARKIADLKYGYHANHGQSADNSHEPSKP